MNNNNRSNDPDESSSVIFTKPQTNRNSLKRSNRDQVAEIEKKKLDLEKQMELLEQNKKILREKMEMELKLKMLKSSTHGKANSLALSKSQVQCQIVNPSVENFQSNHIASNLGGPSNYQS